MGGVESTPKTPNQKEKSKCVSYGFIGMVLQFKILFVNRGSPKLSWFHKACYPDSSGNKIAIEFYTQEETNPQLNIHFSHAAMLVHN